MDLFVCLFVLKIPDLALLSQCLWMTEFTGAPLWPLHALFREPLPDSLLPSVRPKWGHVIGGYWVASWNCLEKVSFLCGLEDRHITSVEHD